LSFAEFTLEKEAERMRVLGLVASPRKLGNSEILVKEMLASLPAETEKEMIRLTDLNILNCNACYGCLAADKSCVLKDDLGFLLARIKAADAVIIGSACYVLGSHTSIKLIGDRIISVLANSSDFTGKRCVTAISYGIPGWDGYAREAVNNFARFLHLDVVGSMVVQAASPGEVVVPEVLTEARSLAARLVVAGSDIALPDMLTCSVCGSSVLQIKPTGQVRCPMCNTTGNIVSSAAGTSIKFEDGGHSRYSPQGMSEHSQVLEGVKQHYVANRGELYKRRKPYGDYDWWVLPPK
jgi:multimeric flavodoxin WrbA